MIPDSLGLPPALSKRLSSVPSYVYDVGAVLLIAIAAIALTWRMLRDGVNGLGDLPWHLTWIQHFAKQVAEGDWYPRWLAGTNYGYGSPTFVFYPPLVYYLGAGFRILGLDIQPTIAALCTIALFASGLSFYLYGYRWGRVAAIGGALFYVSAPQLTNLAYFGGLAALFAQPLMPLGVYFTDKALVHARWNVALAVFWAVVALTHVPSLLLCTIAWVIYLLALLLKHSWKRVVTALFAAGLGFGMASFFLLPAILEQSFANIKALKAVNGGFQANMIGNGELSLLPLTQLQKMAYIYVHQGLAIALFATIVFLCCRKDKFIIRQTWNALIFSIALALMMSSVSTPIWQASPTLQMVQFPVRLLGLFALAGSILCAIAIRGILALRPRVSIVLAIIVAGMLLANFRYSYQLSRRLPTINNPGRGAVMNLASLKTMIEEPYSDKLVDLPEYRPLLKNNASTFPIPLLNQPRIAVTSGNAKVQLQRWDSNFRVFEVSTPTPSTINVRTYYYPAWRSWINQKPQDIEMANDGTIELKLPAGNSVVELRYGWTQAFTIGVILSGLSTIVLISLWIGSFKIQLLK